ncbi:MAG: hypothetical protein ABI472_18765 [Ginsengibacter sp.]
MIPTSTVLPKYFKSAIFFSIIVMIVACSSSKKNIVTPQGWVVIGETKANFVRETDIVKVYSLDRFTDLRFRVEDRTLKISEMTIYFENGDKLTPKMEDVIEPDQYSRVINIADNGKRIDRLELKYRTTGSILKGRAKIIIIGKQYSGF